MRRLTFAAVLVVCIAFRPAAAQYPQEVAPGARLSITLPDSARQAPLQPSQQTVIGTLTAITGDTLHIQLPFTAGETLVPRTSVRRLQVSLGVPGRLESAFRNGFGTAIGLALTSYLGHMLADGTAFESDGEAAAVGAGVGFGLGFILGAVSPSERWRSVRLPD